MGQLRDRMEADLRLAGYSPSTRKIYLLYAKLFTKFHIRSPAETGEEEIRQYLRHIVEEKKISRETYRQIRAAHLPLQRNAKPKHRSSPGSCFLDLAKGREREGPRNR